MHGRQKLVAIAEAVVAELVADATLLPVPVGVHHLARLNANIISASRTERACSTARSCLHWSVKTPLRCENQDFR
jgi:hypothetical protein